MSIMMMICDMYTSFSSVKLTQSEVTGSSYLLSQTRNALIMLSILLCMPLLRGNCMDLHCA